RLVDAPVLFDKREAVQRRRRDDDLEVVADARPVDDLQLGRVGKRALEQLGEAVGAHASIVPSTRRSPALTSAAAPAASSITTFAPRFAANRQGRSSRTTPSTRRSRSQKIASIAKRMKSMWIELAGRNSIPSPGS